MGSEHDPGDGGVAADLADGFDGEYLTIGGFVESARFAFEGVDVAVDVDMRLFTAGGCRVRGFEE